MKVINKLICSIFGHNFRYNFPYGSQPSKAICKRCRVKIEQNFSKMESEEVLFFKNEKRSDKELIETWFKITRIFILLIPTLTIAQSNFTADGRYLLLPIAQVPIIYNDLQQYKECELEVKRKNIALHELDSIINLMAFEHKEDISTINTLSNSRDELIEAANAKMQSAAVVADRKKWWNSKWLCIAIGAIGGGWIVNSVK